MDQLVVVGFDGSPSSETALARATALGARLRVVSGSSVTPSAIDGVDGSFEHQVVEELTVHSLFHACELDEIPLVVIGEDLAKPGSLIRQSLLAAAQRCRHDRPLACLLVVRSHSDVAGYRRILAAADGTVGSGFAALAAGRIAMLTGAELRVTLVERRKDFDRRRLIDSHPGDPDFDPAEFRINPTKENPRLAEARHFIETAGIPATFDYLVGDPSSAVVDAAHRGGYDLLVSGLVGEHPASTRFDNAGRLTKHMLTQGRVDHLVVLDSITLGVVGARRTQAVLRRSAEMLVGSGA